MCHAATAGLSSLQTRALYVNAPPLLPLPASFGGFPPHPSLVRVQPVLRFFLEPVVRSINYAVSLGYTRIVMAGLSGGGWTTTMLAAIDPRITLAMPVAGSIPCDFEHTSWVSWPRPVARVLRAPASAEQPAHSAHTLPPRVFVCFCLVGL